MGMASMLWAQEEGPYPEISDINVSPDDVALADNMDFTPANERTLGWAVSDDVELSTWGIVLSDDGGASWGADEIPAWTNDIYGYWGNRQQLFVWLDPAAYLDPGEYEIKFFAVDTTGNRTETAAYTLNVVSTGDPEISDIYVQPDDLPITHRTVERRVGIA